MGPLQEMARIRPQRAVVNVEEEAGSHTDRGGKKNGRGMKKE